MPNISIIIPTLRGRDYEFQEARASIFDQGRDDIEIIKVTEDGELAKLRNLGASRARGKYLVFIDDDVVCYPGWLDAIIKTFQSSDEIAGVSGKAIITSEYKRNRDIFRFRIFKGLYDLVFCPGQSQLPGHITKSGAWTTGACNRTCDYEGEVHFLEACNMAFRADIFNEVSGFDESFKGVGDWSEPDLSFRIRKLGYKLWFSGDATLEHRPSKSGAFKKRLSDSRNRLANYELFASRWVKPCWQHSLYKQFLRTYYAIKTTQ